MDSSTLGGSKVVTQQPMGWMQQPELGRHVGNCPPGLEYLAMIDQLLVKQKMSLAELVLDWETENKYDITNTMGQKVYDARENSNCLARQCCGPIRNFEISVSDAYEHEVIHFHRPLRCQAICFPCCLQKMEVSAPPGSIIGKLEQQWNIFPRFRVKDNNGNVIFLIKGPFFTCSCFCNDVGFDVLDAKTGEQIGKITKQFSGILKEAYTDADNFGINFPANLEVRHKALLLGALFLIDAMYFERSEH